LLSAHLTPAELFGGFVAVSTLIALRQWRLGILLAFLAAIAQDPIRKITPGTPGVMAVSSAPIWVAVILAGLLARPRSLAALRRAFPDISGWMLLLTLSLIPATLVLFQHGTQMWRLAALGLYGYLTALGSLGVGIFFVRRPQDLRRLIVVYVVVTTAFLSGVFLEHLETFPQSRMLGTWALGANWDRYTAGVTLGLMTGFYRSPDLMSWHAASVVILALSLALQERRKRALPLIAFAGIAGVCLVLGGRRKMAMMPIIWFAVMTLNLARQGRLSRVFALGAAGTMAAVALFFGTTEMGVSSDYFTYMSSSAQDAPGRLLTVFTNVWRTYNQWGLLGLGIGTATQGARYLGLPAETWQETGLEKLMVELGLAGLICAIALMARIGWTLLKQVRRQELHPAPILHLGFAGFAAANLASYLVSQQAYGDPIVLFGTGLTVGIALSGAHWRYRFEAARAQTRARFAHRVRGRDRRGSVEPPPPSV
jgi:hypothetical protein